MINAKNPKTTRILLNRIYRLDRPKISSSSTKCRVSSLFSKILSNIIIFCKFCKVHKKKKHRDIKQNCHQLLVSGRTSFPMPDGWIEISVTAIHSTQVLKTLVHKYRRRKYNHMVQYLAALAVLHYHIVQPVVY